jgi:uncharacterized protein YjiS (DUF1127 family)
METAMTTLTPPLAIVRLPRFVILLAAVSAAVVQRITRLRNGWRRRHEAVMLVRADEHILADLGICRGDVHDAFSGPPWQDPTVLLRTRALERRLSRHRVAHAFPSPTPTSSSERDVFRRPPTDRPSRLTR